MATPEKEAQRTLRRYMGFVRMGFSEHDARRLSAAEVTIEEVRELLRKRCPKHLVADILT